MYYVYILKCADKTFYTGITNNLVRRIEEHNSSDLGAKYTRGRGPVKLVYSARKRSKSTAMKEECRIKKLSREDKLKLINKNMKKENMPARGWSASGGKKIKIDLKNLEEDKIKEIISSFERGEVIVYPTDTIYGIGCIATNKKAIEKIYKIKKRENKKPFLVLMKSFCMLRKYCFLNKRQDKYLHELKTDKPVSVVLKKRDLLSDELTAKLDSVAVRLPKNDFLLKILKGVNLPIVSTSLNISGKENITNVKNIEKSLNTSPSLMPDLVIDAGELIAKSSQLIDLRDMDDIKVLRK